jgi:hypothetical protein
MSKVNSDEQRIQEMNEMQLRQAKQLEKRDQEERTTRSFNQVMSERTQREQGRQLTAKQTAAQEQAAKPKAEVPGRVLPEQLTRTPREVAARAALFRDQDAGQVQRRGAHVAGARESEASRTTQLVERGEEERELRDRDVRKDDLRDAQETEERYAARTDGQDAKAVPNPAVERDKGGRGQQSQKDDQAAVEEVQSKGAAGGPERIPVELLERIVSAIHTATQADGRSEIVVSLQGTMLDGVTLRVASKKGKIRCVFEGCDKQTKNLIESSKGELMRALARKGLELDILRVK